MTNNPLKILVSAYACSPFHGSEPGMGWNFIKNLSLYYNVHVITEEYEFKADIEHYLEDKPEYAKITFHYIPREHHETLRKFWPPSYYWYYKQWQKKAYHLAVQLDIEEDFDIIHQLNMVGFREPGFLWKIDKPFVWGPIGGLENSPWRFLPSLGFNGFVFYICRNVLNFFQRNFSSRPKRAAKRMGAVLIAASPGIRLLIKQLWDTDSVVICEVGQMESASVDIPVRNDDLIKIVWSGQHTPGKNLSLLLKALVRLSIPYEIHILGVGIETDKWKTLAKRLGISHRCVWHGWLPRESSLRVMKEGHVFCITSVSDLTSTVILEAISLGLPIVTLDHCGFANVVTERCGIKIPVTTPDEASEGIARAIELLFKDEALRCELAKGAKERANDYSWKEKMKQLNQIYKSLLQSDLSPKDGLSISNCNQPNHIPAITKTTPQ